MQKQRFEVAVTPLDAKMAPAPDSQIVFHGINKTGTTAMRKVLLEAYAHAGRANEIYPRPSHRFENQDEMVAFADTHPGPAIVIGHYLYGALQPREERRWVMILRHPLPRIISCYHWLKTRHSGPDDFPALEGFVERSRGVAHSQVFQLGVGFAPDAARRGRALSLPEITERAKQAITRDVAVLGIAEHFEPSIFLFAHLAGLATVRPWQRDDRNKGRPPVDTLTDSQVALIRDVYRYDFELYNWGLAHFAKQLEAVRMGPSLAAYEEACRGAYRERGLG
jgi:hypothetical protein